LTQGKCCAVHDFDHLLSVVVYMNLISFLDFYQIHQQQKKKSNSVFENLNKSVNDDEW
jgi:hypothetical protein